jgi:uncharacterized protein YdaU (DUF1376 family)
MHFYQFHIGDYASHTRHLSLFEDIAYRRLLDFYYLHEQPIKHHDIARQIGMRDQEQDVLTVLNEFFLSTPEGFVSPRADKEIAKFKEFSEAGKRGAAKRWGTNKEANSPPNATPIATNNHKPITNNHIKNTATVVACPDGLDVSVWQDWLKIRKSKKAPLTETSWKLFVKECDKAGWTIDAAVKECCLRNWASFKAEWMKEKQTHTERLSTTMSVLTNGLTTPKKPFWQTEETSDVKRIL